MSKKIDRRDFLRSTLLIGAAGLIPGKHGQAKIKERDHKPGIITTWEHGKEATEKATDLLKKGLPALDVVEKGVNVTEADPDVMSVGYGGLPDESGMVTLDACIMDGKSHRAGSVGCLQHIKHPVSVARKVMELTKHVMLVGNGALDFALKTGFKKENLLTDKARERWLRWKRGQNPNDNWLDESHDTVTMLCLDNDGNIAGACTTSGLAWKIHGRVGDSPIIGAGLYVDNEVGAAGATGVGELVMQTLTSFMIVEFMRQGLSPSQACYRAFLRMCEKIPETKHTQEAFIAINKKGEVGCATNDDRFVYYHGSSAGVERHKPKTFK
jgi:N4-(beta-N-acetylglucosaminyl)-L-asparaginase